MVCKYKQNLDRHTTNFQLPLAKRYGSGWDVVEGIFFFMVYTFFFLLSGNAGNRNQGLMEGVTLELDYDLFTTLHLY